MMGVNTQAVFMKRCNMCSGQFWRVSCYKEVSADVQTLFIA